MKNVRRLIRYIKRVKKATGWGFLKTKYDMDRAKLYGISYSLYVKNHCYNWNVNRIKSFGKILKAKKKTINKIKKETKWSKGKVLKELNKYQKRGINYYYFYNYKCWELNSKETEELAELIKKSNEKEKLNKTWYINTISEKVGCSKEEAEERLKIAKNKGYNRVKFIMSGDYDLPIDELKKMKKYKEEKYKPSDTDKAILNEKEENKLEIMKEMNWTEQRLRLEFLKSNINCGCTFHEYYVLRLYRKTLEEQKEFVTSELWMKLYLRYCDYADEWEYFKQKKLFNEKFKKYVKREWLSSKGLSYRKFKKFIRGKDTFICKPVDAACGNGITMYKVYKLSLLNIITFLKIKLKEESVIEEIIKQHKDMASLNPETVNTVRVQVMVEDGKVNILNATIRMGSKKGSFTDNFSSGGVMATVDPKTGKVISPATSKFGGSYDNHPVTGAKIKGFQIPNWDKAIRMCKEASLVLKNMRYVGWDVVINKNGSTQLIEGNHDADATFHQYCWAILENKGIRHTIDKYIWFNEDEKTI